MTSTYKVHLSENKSYEIEVGEDGSLKLNGSPVELDAVKSGADSYSVLLNNKSYNIQVQAFEKGSKRLVLSVNDETFEMDLTTELDELLSKMGMSADSSAAMVDVRAPMPGLVLKILVESGSEVNEGDALIILEAMKMENIIKATGTGIIGKILVGNQDAVEKNQVLIEME